MANETILISEVIPTTPERIFSAWLDSAEHSSFTGSQAAVLPFVGGEYSAWDGYVQGRTLELNDGARIVQSWRTAEFPAGCPDSRLEITLEATLGGTLLTLLHTDIPSGQSDKYREGWNEYYLSRMKSYFSEAVAAADDADFSAVLDALGTSEIPTEVDAGDVPTTVFGTPDAPPRERAAPKRAAPKRAAPKRAAPKQAAKAGLQATAKAAVKKVKAAAKKAVRKLAKKVVKAAGKKPGKKLGKKPGKKQTAKAAKKATKKAAKRSARQRPQARAKGKATPRKRR